MKASFLLALVAIATLLAIAASGFGARFGIWDFRMGFQILRWGTYAGIAVAVLALIALLVPKLRAQGAGTLVIAFFIAFGAAAFPLYLLHQARALPPINDITTDTADPPKFVAILPLRAHAPVPSVYPGDAMAKQQRAGYPQIEPVSVAAQPRVAFDRALAVARGMGWDIVAADAASGRIEATATTPWFGFRDDVVIRVTSDASGSRIDMRSVSRVGKGDFGTNARRIRQFLTRMTLNS